MIYAVSLALMSLVSSIYEGQPHPQAAATTSQEPSTAVLEDVVVDGRRLREAVDDFVDEIVAPPAGRGPARWNGRVCVGVVNLRRDTAQALADQVSAVADRVGLEIGEPGCRPNILVIGTDDGPALARALVSERPLAFRPKYAGAARSAAALDYFQTTPAAVRWWHVSMPMVRGTNAPGVRLPGEAPPVIPGEGRLRSPLRNDLQRVFVILDMDDATGLTVQQLGDYVGMVALAQIDPEAETSAYDTVLNLFEAPQSQLALTDWDLSYLQALYGAELHQRAVNQQGGEVSNSMFRDLRRTQPEDDEPPPAEPNPGP